MHPVPCDTTSACSGLHLTLPAVSHNPELEINWPEVGLAVLEVGILDGAVGGKIGLNKALSNSGT